MDCRYIVESRRLPSNSVASSRIEKRVREINTKKALCFTKLVKRKFHDQPGLYDSFMSILTEYTYGRFDSDDMYMQVTKLFLPYPVMIRGFGKCFPMAMFTEDDDVETPRPAKKAKTEDDSSKAIPVFDPTSHASTSYASNRSQSPCSSDREPCSSDREPCSSDPFECESIGSRSSSSQSRPGNAAEVYQDQKQEIAESFDGTLYVTETKIRLLDGPQAYEHLTEFVNEIGANRNNTYSIMKRATNLLQGYPELIESFNAFLPDGYRIVTLSDDHEMSTD